jgi:hypothetical protein
MIDQWPSKCPAPWTSTTRLSSSLDTGEYGILADLRERRLAAGKKVAREFSTRRGEKSAARGVLLLSGRVRHGGNLEEALRALIECEG